MGIATYILSYGAALLGVALVAAYLYFTRNFSHWKKKGVKHLKPLPFVGNLKDLVLLRKNIGMVAKDIYDQHKKEPFIGLYAFDEPVLQIHDLDLLKTVLVKDFSYFRDRIFQANKDIDTLNGRNLFALKGDRWRQIRNAITPSFTSGKMKRMYELVAECGQLFVSIVREEKCAGKPIPVYELAARYTTEVIASCAFGIQGNTLAHPKAEFRSKLRLIFEFSRWLTIITAAAFLAPKIIKLLGVKLIRPVAEDYVKSTIKHIVEEREIQKIKRNDLLDSLIELKNTGRIYVEEEKYTTESDNTIKFDVEDMYAQAFVFLTAGFETSATTITFVLYELAKHKDAQDKLRKEILESSKGELLSYETLHGMKYLDMVLKETLRKYPPLPFIDRMSNRPFTLPGTDITLEEGTRILISVHGLHMDSEYHPHPKKFDPERFSMENKQNIIDYTHIPFGEGPRNCVGMRFALMQTKCAVANLLSKYTVNPCSITPEEIEFNPNTFLLQPKENIHLVLRPLS